MTATKTTAKNANATRKPAATNKTPRKSAPATKTPKVVKSVPVAKKAASVVKAVADQVNTVVGTQAAQPVDVADAQETKAASEAKATKPPTREARGASDAPP